MVSPVYTLLDVLLIGGVALVVIRALVKAYLSPDEKDGL